MASRPHCGRVVTVWMALFLMVVIGSETLSAQSQDVTFPIIPLLPPGKSIVLTFDATIIPPPFPAGVDQISMQGFIEGKVGSTRFEPIPTDDPTGSGTAPRPTVTAVDAAPDLWLEKTANRSSVAPGDRLIYTLTYRNVGTQDATGVELREQVPDQTAFDPDDNPGWTCTSEGRCTLPVSDLAVGPEELAASFAVTVANPLPATVTEITNIASIADDGRNGADSNPTNNTATTVTDVTPSAGNHPPLVTAATFRVAENSANGTNVGTVTFTDPDAGQTHTFALTAGNTGNAFALNATTGQLTVAHRAALNFETTPSFRLTVQVTDSGTPPLSGTATITVNLTNVNDAPVVTPATFRVAENSANGTVVGTVAASDADVPAQTLSFVLTAGNTGNAFALNATTGQLTVARRAALNFETTPSFRLTVQVTDSGTPPLSDTATIPVNLTNVNDAPDAMHDTATTPIRTAVTIEVLENDTDEDGDPLTVERVTPGTAGGATMIRVDRRAVIYTPVRDFTGTDDSFIYTVSDGRGGHDTASVAVTVTSADVDLLTPRDQQVVAGQAVSVAAFIVPEDLREIVEAIGGVVSLPADTVAVRFQFRPVGVTAWQDIGTADTPPFFLVPWNTVALPDDMYELRLMARRATGAQLISPPLQVRVDNVTPAEPPDIVADPGISTQQMVASEATVVVMAEGAILGLPAHTLPADDRLTITALSLDEAPGIPPGDIVGLMVETTLESGTDSVNDPLVVFLPYADADDDGLVDGTDIPESALSFWFFDPRTEMWMPFSDGRVQPENNVLVGTENRFGVFAVVHVQDGPQEPLLTVTLGDQSPDPATPRPVSPSTTNVVALQVQVDTGEEDVSLTAMDVVLSPLTGDETLVQQLRVKLFHDTNANGSIDASEALLAMASVPTGNQVSHLSFMPSLLVPADTTTHLLVAVEFSRGDGRTRTVPLAVFPPTVPPWLGVGLGLLAVLCARLRRQHTLRVLLLLCMLGCVLFLTSCPEDGDDVLTATMVLPAQGVTGESETSEAVSGPMRPLRGASVLIVP